MENYKNLEGFIWKNFDLYDMLHVKAIRIIHIREVPANMIPVTSEDGLDVTYVEAGSVGHVSSKLEILVYTGKQSDIDFLEQIMRSIKSYNPNAGFFMESRGKTTTVLLYDTDEYECEYHPELEIGMTGTKVLCPHCDLVVTKGMMHPRNGEIV